MILDCLFLREMKENSQSCAYLHRGILAQISNMDYYFWVFWAGKAGMENFSNFSEVSYFRGCFFNISISKTNEKIDFLYIATVINDVFIFGDVDGGVVKLILIYRNYRT